MILGAGIQTNYFEAEEQIGIALRVRFGEEHYWLNSVRLNYADATAQDIERAVRTLFDSGVKELAGHIITEVEKVRNG